MRESRTLGSVRAKAEWLSYSTIPRRSPSHHLIAEALFTCGTLELLGWRNRPTQNH